MTKKSSFLRVLAVAACVLASSPAVLAADAVPAAKLLKMYGFGYGDDKTPSRCVQVTEKTIARISGCKWEKEVGSFSTKSDFYTCQGPGAGEEFVIYATKSRCDEELSSMNANGD